MFMSGISFGDTRRGAALLCSLYIVQLFIIHISLSLIAVYGVEICSPKTPKL